MKKLMLILGVCIICIQTCSGCGPKRIATTISGRPEMIIDSNNMDLVKSTIITTMNQGNFFLEDDSKYRLVFTKEMKGSGAVISQLLIGNSYSTTPIAEISFNLSTIDNKIKIVIFSSISTQMAFGQNRRVDMKNNNAWFNEQYQFLQQIRSSIENKNTAMSKVP